MANCKSIVSSTIGYYFVFVKFACYFLLNWQVKSLAIAHWQAAISSPDLDAILHEATWNTGSDIELCYLKLHGAWHENCELIQGLVFVIFHPISLLCKESVGTNAGMLAISEWLLF